MSRFLSRFLSVIRILLVIVSALLLLLLYILFGDGRAFGGPGNTPSQSLVYLVAILGLILHFPILYFVTKKKYLIAIFIFLPLFHLCIWYANVRSSEAAYKYRVIERKNSRERYLNNK